MTLGDHYNGNAAVHEDRYTYVFIQSILGSLSFLDLSKKDEGGVKNQVYISQEQDKISLPSL